MSRFIAVLLLNLSLFTLCYASAFDSDSLLYPEIRSIELVSFSAETNSAVFDVNVYNPNEFKLPVRELTGKILLNEQPVSVLEATSKKSLAALSSQMFTVPIKINPTALTNAANNVVISGVAHYQFRGYMMTPVGELPLSHSGKLTAEQILTFLQLTLFKPIAKSHH